MDEDKHQLSEIKTYLHQILHEIDDLKYGDEDAPPSFGDKMADKIVSFVGSWKFISMQCIIYMIWIGANAVWLSSPSRFDPYPFILLNLFLSFQAAFNSPLILMSQNRAEQRDRRRAFDAYKSIEHIEKMMLLLTDKLKIAKENGHKNGPCETKPSEQQ